ncbi:hypothetical protein PUN28_016634 [Cardiocondyla obscurior]|uniref:Uncharacterized protein n=1 Tax=Cardiocondyla obscurior TaxID=286306 RepID=A0AAW2ESW0_9HYME
MVQREGPSRRAGVQKTSPRLAPHPLASRRAALNGSAESKSTETREIEILENKFAPMCIRMNSRYFILAAASR